jgi:hypothetical protein
VAGINARGMTPTATDAAAAARTIEVSRNNLTSDSKKISISKQEVEFFISTQFFTILVW